MGALLGKPPPPLPPSCVARSSASVPRARTSREVTYFASFQTAVAVVPDVVQ